MNTLETKQIEFTRISNDVNGNPRYVCHYSNFISDNDFKAGTKNMTRKEVTQYTIGMSRTDYGYKVALKRAKQFGGKKFHNKQYGGGIVFTSANIFNTERRIHELMASL